MFAERYAFDNTPIPALGTDALLAALQTVLDVHAAGKVLLTLTLLAYLLGGHLLGCASHGRPTWLALGTGLFAYHSMFFYGYTNYSLSVGLFLMALAGYVTWSGQPSWRRLALFQLLVLLCYFTHLGGFLLLGAAVSVLTLSQLAGERRPACLLMTLPLVTPVLLFLAFRTPPASQDGVLWSTLAEKIIGGLCLVRTYSTTLDAVYLVLLVALAAATALALRQTRCHGGVLLAGLLFLALFVLGPKEINGGGAPADARFLPAAAPLLLLAPRLTLRRRWATPLLAGLLGLLALRTTVIASEWRIQDRELVAQVALFAQLPDGATLYPIVALDADPAAGKRDRALWHAVHYATIERHTYSPGLLAYPGQQPIRYRQRPFWQHSNAEHFTPLERMDWPRVCAAYEYIWCYRPPADYRRFLDARCEVVASNGRGVIYRVVPRAPLRVAANRG